jgi:hypothetical protein
MTEVPKIVHDRLRAVMAGQSSPDPNSAGSNSARTRHPDANLLTAFVEQALSPAERDGVLEHLALCGDCREVTAIALPALDVDIDIAVTPVAGETDAARTMPIEVKAQRSWLSSPKLAWANLRWATAVAAVGVVASVILLRPGKLNQPTHPPAYTQARTAEPPISGTQIASSTADQITALTKTGEVRSTPEKQSGVRPEMQSAKKPDARRVATPPQQTETGILLADNRFRNDNDKDRDENKDRDEKKGSLRVDGLLGATPAPTNGAIVNSPMNRSSMNRGATETVEVSAADTAIETAPPLDSTLTAHSEAPAIVKTKPALKEMDTSVGSNAGANASANVNEVQTTDAAISPSAVKSQAQEFAYAKKITLPANAALSPNVTWAIIEGALQRSLDSGRSWQSVLRADHPLQSYASHNQNVWVGGLAGTLFHSADGGLTWVRAHPSIKNQSLSSDITHIEVLDSGEIVVSTNKNEIWNSGDGGQTWGKK